MSELVSFVLAFLMVVAMILVGGAMILTIGFLGSFLDDLHTRRRDRRIQAVHSRRCPVCNRGNSVLLNEDTRSTHDWCRPHFERLMHIRELEREVLDQ